MKKILTILLCVCFIFGFAVPTVFADTPPYDVTFITKTEGGKTDLPQGKDFVFYVCLEGTYDSFSVTIPNGLYYTIKTIEPQSGSTLVGNRVYASGLGDDFKSERVIAKVTATCVDYGVSTSIPLSIADCQYTKSLGSEAGIYQSYGQIRVCNHPVYSAVATTPATCLVNGERTVTCTTCADTWVEPIIASGHTVHSWADNGDTHQGTCSACLETVYGTHSFTDPVWNAPSCTAAGFWTSTCICGKTQNTEEAGSVATGHSCTSWTKVDDTTHQGNCSVCGAPVSAEHDFVNYAGKVWTDPDCVNAGKWTYTCHDCDATKVEYEGTPTTHSYAGGKAEKVDDATHRLVCDGCNIANGDVVAHTFAGAYVDNGDGTHTKNCSADGCTYQLVEEHIWVRDAENDSAATCQAKAKEAYKCACGQTKQEEVGETADHSYVGGAYLTIDSSTHRQICDACGIANGEVTAHGFVYTDLGNGSHKKECSDCGFTGETEVHNCDWSGGEVTEAATCIAKAKKKYTCEHCGAQWEDVDDDGEFGAHDFDTPTKVDSAKHKRTCSVCGLIETVAHTFPPEWTPNGDGLLHYHTCACGATEYVPHTWDTGDVIVPPTDSSDGVRRYVCSGCGAMSDEPIPKLDHEHTYSDEWVSDGSNHWKTCACGDKTDITPHTFNEGRVDVAPTCKTVGKKVMTCTVCGAEKTEDIPLVEHSFSEATVTKEPTCTMAGEKTGVCITCGAIETAGIPALGHTAGEFEITEEATCKQVGKKVQRCITCGEVLKEEATPMKEHTYGAWTDDDGISKRICTECGAVDTKVEREYTQILTEEDSGFALYALEGKGFVDGWRLIVQEVTDRLSDSERTSLVTSAKVLNKNYFVANTFDIWLEDASGNRVEYKGKMRVEFPMPRSTVLSSVTVVGYTMASVNEKAGLALRETEIKQEEETAEEKINFKTEELGRFCLLGEQPDTAQSKGMDTWMIVLLAIIAVLVPVGAFLVVFFGRRKQGEEEDF